MTFPKTAPNQPSAPILPYRQHVAGLLSPTFSGMRSPLGMRSPITDLRSDTRSPFYGNRSPILSMMNQPFNFGTNEDVTNYLYAHSA